MLIIKPIQDKDEQKKHCGDCSAEFEADSLSYAAWIDERLAGICQFTFGSDGAHIVTLRPANGTDDWDALFIMGRQTMNYTDLHGIHTIYYDDAPAEGMPEDFRLKLGFPEKDGRFVADLNGFFDSPCSHDHGNADGNTCGHEKAGSAK